NRERIREYHRQWRLTNPDQVRAHAARRRALAAEDLAEPQSRAIWRGPRTRGALAVAAEPHAAAAAGPEAVAAVAARRRACGRWRREPSTRHGLMTTTGQASGRRWACPAREQAGVRDSYTSWSIRHSTRPLGGPAGGATT